MMQSCPYIQYSLIVKSALNHTPLIFTTLVSPLILAWWVSNPWLNAEDLLSWGIIGLDSKSFAFALSWVNKIYVDRGEIGIAFSHARIRSGEEKSMSSQSDENISTLETIAFKSRY